MIRSLLFSLLLCSVCPAVTFAQNNASPDFINEPDTLKDDSAAVASLIIESDFNNKYLWRGILFQNAATWNPNITYAYKNFSVNLWANLPFHYYNIEEKPEQDFEEIDFNFNYEIEGEVSYTMISHSAQVYTPVGQGDWYWGMVSVFQGFYKGDIGIYINPEINYHPFIGGMFIETGFNYNHEGEKSETDVYLAYSTSNKIIAEYNICSSEDGMNCKPFQTIKFDASYQYNFNSVFIRPHITYFHLLNYSETLGYRDNFSFGIAVGLQKN